jgi:hypothetical protein
MAKGFKKATQADEKSAMDIAQGIQSPGQTKEQTRLVARGIEKGIAQYKKRHSTRERELDKALKRLERDAPEPRAPAADVRSTQALRDKQHWLPWAMLILTWLGIAGFALWQLRGQA